jgi:hypothetical protein
MTAWNRGSDAIVVNAGYWHHLPELDGVFVEKRGATWSPDGQRLLFACRIGGTGERQITAAAGEQPAGDELGRDAALARHTAYFAAG